MSSIEFTSLPGKTFSVQVYDATTGGALGSPITGVTDSLPTRYRADLGSVFGVVYIVATATNLRVAGYADLDRPNQFGYSALLASVEELASYLALDNFDASLDNISATLAVVASAVSAIDTLQAGVVPNLIQLYTGSTEPVGVPVRGTIPELDLSLVINTKDGKHFATLSVTSNSTSFTFTPTADLTAKAREFTWSLRKPEANQDGVVAFGPMKVIYAAMRAS